MTTSMLEQTLHDLLTTMCTVEVVRAADRGEWQQPLWDALEGAGMTRVGLPESHGGSGGRSADAVTVIRVAGSHAVPLPLIETSLLGGWILSRCGLNVPDGPITVMTTDGPGGASAAWARHAAHIVAVTPDGRVDLFEREHETIVPAENLANEPRDFVEVTDRPAIWSGHLPEPEDSACLNLRAALGRSAAIAGAAERVLAMTIRYASEREQFGRPIVSFQAVGQMLAIQAAEVAAAHAAVQAATRPLELRDVTADDEFRIAAAKVRTSRASTEVARIAHQVHGAIGFTDEHPLHLFTRRLEAWRDEDGSDHEWSLRLGALAFQLAPDEVWSATL